MFAFSVGKVPKNPALALGYWAANWVKTNFDGEALYNDLERYASHLQRLRKDTNSVKHSEGLNEPFAEDLNNLVPASFQRLSPRSEASKTFSGFQLEIEGMKIALELEAKTDPRYFQDVLNAAVIIASRYGLSKVSSINDVRDHQ